MSVAPLTGVARSTQFSDLPLDCIMRILTFSKDPLHARVCKLWHSASQQSYRWILDAYREDAKLSRFTPAAVGNLTLDQCSQSVQCVYSAVMDNVKALHLPDELITGLHRLSLLNLHSVVDIIESTNLVRLFSRLKSRIPENEGSRFKGDLVQQAALIRMWMEDHQTVLNQANYLNLTNLKLTALPPEIGRLENLQWLYLCNNQFTDLPPEIGRLGKLKWVDLAYNQLTTLPPEIGKLENLEWLFLSKNQLISLPPEIGRLVKLRNLDLSCNRLSTLPQEMGKLKNLRCVNIKNNQLAILPHEVRQLMESLGIKISLLVYTATSLLDGSILNP